MTNLTLHHDDLEQLFVQGDGFADYVGRFGLSKLHYYTQNHFFMPFLQMAEGVFFMSIYGMLVAYFWGARQTLDIVLIASILCVFPYMAQVYQYNSAVATYSLAHLLAALAVMLSTRSSALAIIIASLLYAVAFSIYQSVVANAAAIFCIWMLCKIVYIQPEQSFFSWNTARSSITALASVFIGGVIYVALVYSMGIEVNTYQSANQAFSLDGGGDLLNAFSNIIHGTRSFFFWPQNYFPDYLKKVQLLLLVLSGFLCIWIVKGYRAKIFSATIFSLALFTPRVLQLLHSDGRYHDLTLTGYAVVVAGFVLILSRSGFATLRNISSLLTIFLIAGYIIQCNWISSVNQLNMFAHYSTVTQIFSRVKSLPQDRWDGKTVTVIGNYHHMPAPYPYKSGTGIATEFIDARHMYFFAKLMRENLEIIHENYDITPELLAYSNINKPWPHPDSVGLVNGTAVVLLSSLTGKTSVK